VIESYRDLKVWQSAMDLTVSAYRATSSFPKEEVYGLTSQMRRSAVSIAANIAEGYGRDTTGSYVQCLKIARGSLKEFETHVLLSRRLEFLDMKLEPTLLAEAEQIGKMLNALIKSVEQSRPH
jgi:four helix bundle protein